MHEYRICVSLSHPLLPSTVCPLPSTRCAEWPRRAALSHTCLGLGSWDHISCRGSSPERTRLSLINHWWLAVLPLRGKALGNLPYLTTAFPGWIAAQPYCWETGDVGQSHKSDHRTIWCANLLRATRISFKSLCVTVTQPNLQRKKSLVWAFSTFWYYILNVQNTNIWRTMDLTSHLTSLRYILNLS